MKDHLSKYEQIAQETGRPIEEIQKICDSQFLFLKKVMAKGDDEQYRIQYLGTFGVKPNRRANLAKKRKRMKDYHDKRKQEE
jgi:hypothetical protein